MRFLEIDFWHHRAAGLAWSGGRLFAGAAGSGFLMELLRKWALWKTLISTSWRAAQLSEKKGRNGISTWVSANAILAVGPSSSTQKFLSGLQRRKFNYNGISQTVIQLLLRQFWPVSLKKILHIERYGNAQLGSVPMIMSKLNFFFLSKYSIFRKALLAFHAVILVFCCCVVGPWNNNFRKKGDERNRRRNLNVSLMLWQAGYLEMQVTVAIQKTLSGNEVKYQSSATCVCPCFFYLTHNLSFCSSLEKQHRKSRRRV